MGVLRVTVTENPFIPIDPTPPQAVFLSFPVREAFYGGAAGGGKSAALLAAALQYVQVPGYAALLLRRSFADLMKPGSLIPLSFEWLKGSGAEWNQTQHQWTFPSGATLNFGYLKAEIDKYQYQSSAFQFVGFDELTQFTLTMYTYLFSRMRRLTGVGIPIRMRSASNPGNIGHKWVRDRFVTAVRKMGRLFVPAKLEDNPHLDRLSYEETLLELDPVTRAQLRHGDWKIRPEGNLFKRAWFEIVDPDQVPRDLRYVRYWDLAATEEEEGDDPDYTSGVKTGVSREGVYFVANAKHFKESPKEVEKRIRQTARIDGYDCEIGIEQEGGASGKSLISHYVRNVLPGYAVRGFPAIGDKVTRAQAASAAAERGEIRLVRGDWNEEFLDELCAFPQVPHDDQVDAFVGGYNKLSRAGERWGPETWGKVLSYAEPKPQSTEELLRRAMRGGV